jgi:hypothetical protein
MSLGEFLVGCAIVIGLLIWLGWMEWRSRPGVDPDARARKDGLTQEKIDRIRHASYHEDLYREKCGAEADDDDWQDQS